MGSKTNDGNHNPVVFTIDYSLFTVKFASCRSNLHIFYILMVQGISMKTDHCMRWAEAVGMRLKCFRMNGSSYLMEVRCMNYPVEKQLVKMWALEK